MSSYLVCVKRVLIFMLPRLVAIIIGLLILAVIFPSILPPEEAAKLGESDLAISPKVFFGVVVFIPVVFIVQWRYRGLKLAGWLILCLFIALGMA